MSNLSEKLHEIADTLEGLSKRMPCAYCVPPSAKTLREAAGMIAWTQLSDDDARKEYGHATAEMRRLSELFSASAMHASGDGNARTWDQFAKSLTLASLVLELYAGTTELVHHEETPKAASEMKSFFPFTEEEFDRIIGNAE